MLVAGGELDGVLVEDELLAAALDAGLGPEPGSLGGDANAPDEQLPDSLSSSMAEG